MSQHFEEYIFAINNHEWYTNSNPCFIIDFVKSTITYRSSQKKIKKKDTFALNTLEANILKYIAENAPKPVNEHDIILHLEVTEPGYDYEIEKQIRNAKDRINRKFNELFETPQIVKYSRGKYWVNPDHEVRIVN